MELIKPDFDILRNRDQLGDKEKEIVQSITRIYSEEGWKNLFVIYKRLYKAIHELPVKVQLDIIHEASCIAYDARINAYDELKEQSHSIDDMSNEELTERLKELKQEIKDIDEEKKSLYPGQNLSE